MISIYSASVIHGNLARAINSIPPPPAIGTEQLSPPFRRRLSVNEDFQQGHHLWQDNYDGYLRARAGDVAEEVPNGASNEFYIEAKIGDRTGYIPQSIVTDI